MGNRIVEDDVEIAVVEKNAREVIKITSGTYRGYKTIRLWVWYQEGDKLLPSKGGLAFRAEKLDEIIAALTKARTADVVPFPLTLMTDDQQDDFFKGVEERSRLLPAWFVSRMMEDNWFFGLLLSTGQTLAISQIDDVHQGTDGSLWIDVEMIDHGTAKTLTDLWPRTIGLIGAPTSRRKASVNVAHIVCAMELADT